LNTYNYCIAHYILQKALSFIRKLINYFWPQLSAIAFYIYTSTYIIYRKMTEINSILCSWFLIIHCMCIDNFLKHSVFLVYFFKYVFIYQFVIIMFITFFVTKWNILHNNSIPTHQNTYSVYFILNHNNKLVILFVSRSLVNN